MAVLSPYEGYMLDADQPAVLTYPGDGTLSLDPVDELVDQSLSRNIKDRAWEVKSSDFEFNGSITAELNLGKDLSVSLGDILAAFEGDECRGVAQAIEHPFGDYPVFPLMIYGHDERNAITFKYYSHQSGQVINIAEKITFTPDMTLGNAIQTVVLNSQSVVDAMVSEFELKAAYPNPFNPTTTLEYAIDVAGDINISILDINGRLVEVLFDGFSEKGIKNINWDASYNPSGVYFVKLISGNNIQTLKLVLMK